MHELCGQNGANPVVTDELFLTNFFPKKSVRQLLAEHENVYETVLRAETSELAKLPGMNERTLQKVKTLREFLARWQNEKKNSVKIIRCPRDVFDYLADMQSLQQEQFRVVMMNTKHHIIAQKTIFQGTINNCIVSAKEIFQPAIQSLAAGIILAHNHPSGDSTPSDMDIDVTKRLVLSGKLLEITVLDHIVIGKHEYSSLKEKSLLPDA